MTAGSAAAEEIIAMTAGSAAAEEIIAEGGWQKHDYEVAGVWRIVRDADGDTVVLGDDFETKNGPDLHILLSRKPLLDISHDNAIQGALVVGPLQTNDTSLLFKKMKGAQSLPLPRAIDLSLYRTILIHCVQHAHLWAGAELGITR